LSSMDFQLSSDDKPTRCEVSYPAGKATAINPAREAANNGFPRSISVETVNGNAWGANEVANYMLTRSGDSVRIKSMEIDLDTADASFLPTLFKPVNPPEGLYPTQRLRVMVPSSHFGVSYLDVHAQGWEERYGEKGSRIKIDTSPAFTVSDVVPEPEPGDDPLMFPVVEIAVYKMMYPSDGPTINTIQTGFNVLRLAFMMGSPLALPGWGAQGKTSFLSQATTLRANGVRIVASIGGAGNSVNTSDRAAFINAIVALRDEMGFLDGIDWDIEGVALNEADIVYISTALKAMYGQGFGITFAAGGSHFTSYLPVAVACHNAGVLDGYGQQYYDAPVDQAAMSYRIQEALNAGLPASKIGVGMMIANDANHWTNATCVSRMTHAKNTYGVKKAYLWEASRTGTSQWITDMKTLLDP